MTDPANATSREARIAHAKAWLCKRWNQEHPNAQHVIQLADYAATLADEAASQPRKGRCTCVEVAGENVFCTMHGRGTVWAKENPDLCEIAERLGLTTKPDTAPTDQAQGGGEVERLRAEVQREEAAHLATIEERDAAEEALSEAYRVVCGREPQWSNLFGYADAINDMSEAAALAPSNPTDGEMA